MIDIVIEEFYKSSINGNIIKVEVLSSFAHGPHIGGIQSNFGFTGGAFNQNTLILATPEEKRWLQACIKANKFIPKAEALKVDKRLDKYKVAGALMPIYNKDIKYRCIDWWLNDKDQYFPVLNDQRISFGTKEYNDETYILYDKSENHIQSHNYYMISERELSRVLDELGIVEEPEFVLPKKWCVKGIESSDGTRDSRTKLAWNRYLKKLHPNSNYIGDYAFKKEYYYYYLPSHKSGHNTKSIPIDHTEITYEQFLKYVLKEDIEVKETVVEDKSYKLSDIKSKLSKLYEKEDVQDILEIITK